MRTKSELMRDQAARLLALSTQAREAGNSDLAELLAEAAANCLANIVKDELDDHRRRRQHRQRSNRPRNNSSKSSRSRKRTET